MRPDTATVPFFGQTRLPDTEREAIREVVADTLALPWPYGADGPVDRFERALARHVGSSHAVACSSGTTALRAALHIALGDRDPATVEVVTTSFTFGATVMPAAQLGLRITVVDIDPGDLLANESLLAQAVADSRGTPVLIPVHLNGMKSSCPEARALTRSRGGIIIDDAAQRLALGLPRDSDAWCFSLGPTKNIMGIAEAGAIAVNDSAAAERLRLYLNNGNAGGMVHTRVGENGKPDGIAAAVLERNLSRLDDWDSCRAAVAARYRETFIELGPVGDVRLVDHQADSVFHKLPVLVERRDDLVDFLTTHGVEVGLHYPHPLHEQPALTGRVAFRGAGTRDEARIAADRIMTLPIHPWVDHRDIGHICTLMKEFYAHRA